MTNMNKNISISKVFSIINEPNNNHKINLYNVRQCIKHIIHGIYFDEVCIYGEDEVLVSFSKRGYTLLYMSTIYKVHKSFIAEQLELIALRN